MPERKRRGRSHPRFLEREDTLAVRIRIAEQAAQEVFVFDPTDDLFDGQKSNPVQLWALCGPGDDLEPVITIMLEGED